MLYPSITVRKTICNQRKERACVQVGHKLSLLTSRQLVGKFYRLSVFTIDKTDNLS